MRRDWLKLLVLLLPVLTGCLSHTRRLQQPVLAGPVLNADVLDLVKGVNDRYDKIQSLTATMDFSASVGGAHQGKQTDYTSIHGYILFRKPRMLRVLGLVPVLHTHAFDLVSNGNTFTLLIPPKDRAIAGSNSVTAAAANPLENLRPGVFVDSILIHSISPDQIVSVIHESSTTLNPRMKRLVELPQYDLTVLSEADPISPVDIAKVAKPLRVIRFSRVDLLPEEQDIYNAAGDLETQVLYGPYRDFDGTKFPSTIDISRPIDGYRIRMAVEKLVVNPVNPPLTDETFEVTIPPGYKVQKLP
jgi:outer membrane lipoprotein-sorting protein